MRSYGTNLLSKLLEDFSRVVIKKDRNNLMVELAEGTAPKEEAPAAEAAKAASVQKPAEKPRKALPKGQEGAAAKEKKAVEPAPEEASEPKAAEAAAAAPEAADEAASAVEVDAKPGRAYRVRRSRRSGSKEAPAAGVGQAAAALAQLAAVQPVPAEESPEKPVAQPEEPVAEKKQAKPKRAAAKKADAAAKKDGAAPKKVTAKQKASGKQKPAADAPKQKQQTPASFIQSIVDKAGASGMNVADVGNALRSQFKNFKVKDLGYPRLATYLQEQPLFRVERRDGVVYVFTKNHQA